MKVTAVILTKNEEENIKRCLKSLYFCDEIIIVDDFSTDQTIKLIKDSKVTIFERKLNNDFASQRNFGLNKATNNWTLFIDADETVTNELKNEIMSLDTLGMSKAYYVRRRDYFWGKELKYGETKKVRNQGIVRLVKKNSGRWMGTVHEVFHTAKTNGKLNGFLNHYPHPTLKEFINAVNYYSTIRSDELFNRGKKTNIFEIIFFPMAKFIYNYFFNFGFLDGPAGFTYAFMMSFHSFLVRAKLYLFCHSLEGGNPERLDPRLHGDDIQVKS